MVNDQSKGLENVTAAVSSIVCRRYANSLVDLASDAKSLDQVSADLNAIQNLLKESEDFRSLVHSPRISKSQQILVIGSVSEKANFSKLTSNFLNVLVQNRRLNALESIIPVYFKEVSRRRGDVDVRVETAVEMSSKQSKELEKRISEALQKSVSIRYIVNPHIMGGMIMTIGSYMIDDSVRRKLDRLGAVLIGGSSQNNNAVQNLKEVI